MNTTCINDQDAQLVEQARHGDEAAMGALTERHRQRVFLLIERMIGNRERAEELCFEAFVRAFKNLASFRGDAKFSSWIYRIAVNLALGERAKRKLDQVSLEQAAPLAANSSTSPEFVYQNLFYGKVIDQALAQLPDNYALALRMFYLRGLGYVEIAEAMKIPLGTVKTYLHRGKKVLRSVIGEKYRPEELF